MTADPKPHFFARHRFLSVVGALLLIAVFALVIKITHDDIESNQRQKALEPFYTPPSPLPAGSPGEIISQEPLDVTIPGGGQGVRILYLSEQSDGTMVASSGMVFYPAGPAPSAKRKVVAWAHGTVGMADECAPSRTDDPIGDMTWLSGMLSRGWVVAATDYAGLGTPGTGHYLVGRDEARDVINSVRAAQKIEAAQAGSDYVVWGHSQGGHAALFTAMESPSYAPELNLVATAAAAPAAEMATLISGQYQSAAGWVIGPEVLVAWPGVYPDISIDDVTTSSGLKRYEAVANDCIEKAGEEGLIRKQLGQDFFKANPVEFPAWYDAATMETPSVLPPSQPLLIAQGLSDRVVLPDTTMLYVQRSCDAGANLSAIWLGATGHQVTAKVAGPTVTIWLDDRFQGKPTSPVCGQILPVQPAKPVAPPTTVQAATPVPPPKSAQAATRTPAPGS